MSVARGSWWVVGGAALLSLAAAACTSGSDFPPAPPPEGTGGSTASGAGYTTGAGAGAPGEACSPELAKKPCHVTLGEHDGLLDCFDGFQECLGGHWSLCTEGSASRHLRAPRGRAVEIPVGATLADLEAAGVVNNTSYPVPLVADAGPCDNPCDPTCGQITETGPDGGTETATAVIAWTVAPTSTAGSSGLSMKGYNQPCGAAWDCEFDNYCSYPVTSTVSTTQCVHDKCASGAALSAATCSDACVQAVCAADGHCCSQCTRNPCAAGAAQTTACEGLDTCVAAVCTATSSCCTTAWTTACVNAYATCRAIAQPGFTCPASPPPIGWDATCVQDVHDFCGLDCVNDDPVCAHDMCLSGGPLAGGCDPGTESVSSCVSTICALPGLSYCCSTQWDQGCITAIPVACGTSCPSSAGVCVPWGPNAVDPLCGASGGSGVDLTASIACVTPTTGTPPSTHVVPVCNVGTQPSPANTPILINVYAANSSQIPSYPPSNNGANIKAVCTTATMTPPNPQVQPGKCIDVPCTTSKNQEIFINPPGAGQIAECDYYNNWSINADPSASSFVSCDSPSCSPPNTTEWARPVHMFIAVDRSTTMPAGILSTIQSGLTQYFNDPAALTGATTDTQISLGSFPQTTCSSTTCGSTSCMTTGSAPKALALSPFVTSNVGTFTAWTGSSALSATTNIASYSDALEDAVAAATSDYDAALPASAWVLPYEIVVLVLGSDPTLDQTCVYNPATLAGIAATGYASAANVRTFVLYGGSALASTAEAIAVAGNGGFTTPQYGYPFANPTDIDNALQSIRTQSFPCWITLPATSLFNTSNPDVFLQTPSATTTYTQVFGGVSNCTGANGYYYDNDANPTRLFLCPQTCQNASEQTSTTSLPTGIHYKLSCPSLYATATLPGATYSGSCPVEGTSVEWRYLTYSTLLPTQTSVQFTVQTPTMSMPQQVAWAGNGNPGVCGLGGPSGCPIDLAAALDGTAAQGPAFGNTITVGGTLNPNLNKTAAPTVQSWQVFYDCPFNQ